MSIILDDRDLSFTYEGPWYFGGAQSEYDVTTTGTSTIGSMVLFKFTGVSVSVFGTIGPSDVGAPVSSYQVDDLPAVIFTAPAQGGTLYHYNFFASTPLANGPHQLKITNLNSSSLWLDYVQYTPSSGENFHFMKYGISYCGR
ncbi:hypothetical protein EDD22DRAFT_367144 [Suillus occidentalis]|nr:hypothetical protein EDD22DRAFT_367144 [Suillus occidentalis]